MFSDFAYDDFMSRFSDEATTRPQVQSASNFSSKTLNTATQGDSTNALISHQQGKRDLGGSKFNMEGLAGLASGASNMMPATGHAEKYNYDPELKAQYMAMEGTKDQIASALGPYGQAARAVEKMGKEVGHAVGGEEGGDIATSIVDPLSTQMELFKNEEATDFEKVLGFVPVAGGIAAKNARGRLLEERQREKNVDEFKADKEEIRDTYRMERGLQSISDLKALREKQLGIIK